MPLNKETKPIAEVFSPLFRINIVLLMERKSVTFPVVDHNIKWRSYSNILRRSYIKVVTHIVY